jgi:uncharacterized protein
VSDLTSLPPAIEGWFSVPTDGTAPHLIGARCPGCGTYVFPPRPTGCPNPACDNDPLDQVPLSRRGRVWSYTENRYAPPPPFVASDPFEPYALAAVELEAEGLVVLGQVARGVLAEDLKVGMAMQLEIDVLDNTDTLIYVWAPAAADAEVK